MSWLPLSESRGILGSSIDAANDISNLRSNNALRKLNEVKAEYAPLSTQAEAASKLAYALQMGPQYTAKMLANSGILANMTPAQQQNALRLALGPTQGNSGVNFLSQLQPPSQQESVAKKLSNHLLNSFGIGERAPLRAINPMNNSTEVQAPQVNNPNDLTAFSETLGPNEDVLEYVAKNNVNSPSYIGKKEQQIELPQLPADKNYDKKTWPIRQAEHEALVAEGAESGKVRVKNIEELDNAVFNAETNQATLNDISDILGSKAFEQIRQVPLAGHHELAYYAKEGTPEQQQMIGRYYTLTGNLIKDASRDFAGQFRKGEQQLLNAMKPGPSDTVDTARGKTETLSYLNRMLMDRSRLTSKIMSQYHVGKLQALEQADKIVTGDKIRKEVHDRLNPKAEKPEISQEHIKWMADKNGITVEEAKKRLKAKGLI
jgi:hypothetical protein